MMPDFVSHIPRNLWTMPRLDREWERILWEKHVAEFYEELVIESKEHDDNSNTKRHYS